jgi:E3 ubiquitin-protein ligase DOA10
MDGWVERERYWFISRVGFGFSWRFLVALAAFIYGYGKIVGYRCWVIGFFFARRMFLHDFCSDMEMTTDSEPKSRNTILRKFNQDCRTKTKTWPHRT